MVKDWSDAYRIGIDAIDDQHQGFFAAAHRLHDHILDCRGEQDVESTIEFLADYAATHFRAEEALMERHGYPLLEGHKRLHAAFFERLDELLHDLRVFGPSQHLADRALEVAQDWLIDHIVDEDAHFAAHLGERG
jgi:hemerythrin